MATLDKQAAWLQQYPSWKVKIQGFADDPGSADQNVKLSQQRAEAVRAYLVSKGVSPARLAAKGYGRDPERLVLNCADLSCKAQNRRVITNLQDS
jgi:peptidoglycan-associated lipoprotein